MFDRELQEAIKVANKEFIAQALERAAAARLEKKPKADHLVTTRGTDRECQQERFVDRGVGAVQRNREDR